MLLFNHHAYKENNKYISNLTAISQVFIIIGKEIIIVLQKQITKSIIKSHLYYKLLSRKASFSLQNLTRTIQIIYLKKFNYNKSKLKAVININLSVS